MYDVLHRHSLIKFKIHVCRTNGVEEMRNHQRDWIGRSSRICFSIPERANGGGRMEEEESWDALRSELTRGTI